MNKKWNISFENIFQHEKIKPNPMIKINCSIMGKIKNISTDNTLNSRKINSGSKTKKPIKKIKKFASITDRGANSGKAIPCFNIEAWLVSELVADNTEFEKNIQGIIPERTKKV
jgi:hypothetical protein